MHGINLGLGLGLGHRHHVSGSAGVFTPLDLEPALFLEAYDGLTLSPDAAGPYTSVQDKSGYANHFQQTANAGQRPVAGSAGDAAAMVFDGVDDNMKSSSYGMPYVGTVFLVCEPKTSLANAIIFGGTASGAARRYFSVNMSGNWSIGAGALNHNAAETATAIPATGGTPFVIAADFGATTTELYINANVAVKSGIPSGGGVPAAGTTIGLYHNGGYAANIAIAAIFATQDGTLLNAAQRRNVGDYFAQKTGTIWG